MSADAFVATLALIGAVIVVASLFSGLVDKVRLPQVALFLALGLLLGPYGLKLIDFPLESPVLQAIATLALVLVLFTDAVSVDRKAVRAHRRLAFFILGPGTLLSAALTGFAAWGLLGLAPAPAAILGAALASTDPVMMRGLLRGDVPPAARQALALESGLNDIVLLPIVLVAIALLAPSAASPGFGGMAVGLFILGPGAGIVIGYLGVVLLDRVRKGVGVRRDYESLYALGVAFAAYAAGEALHASGFLAAFAAGFTIAATDAELCDCFLDFGQAAAEMFLLFTFVAFGGSLIWSGLGTLDLRTLAFAGVALGGRSLVLSIALARFPLDPRSRRLIVWYGPRGLSTLLLVLLPVFAGAGSGVENLFAIASLVVLLSVVLHGGALMILGRSRAAPAAAEAPAVPPAIHAERITISEVLKLQAAGEPVVILDVRTERSYGESDLRAKGAVRMPPDGAAERAAELALPRESWLVAYCT